MGKYKFLKKLRFGNYFRELSIVIIGVAITLAASSIISSIQERSDLNAQLDAIYQELEDNLQRINKLDEFNRETKAYQRYLMEDYQNPVKLDEDSIIKLNKVLSKTPIFVYKRNAYDMLINSGGMKSFKDKKLLLNITDCYALLEATERSHNEYIHSKLDVIKDLFKADTRIVLESIDIKEIPSIYHFHMLSTGDMYTTQETREAIDKVLASR